MPLEALYRYHENGTFNACTMLLVAFFVALLFHQSQGHSSKSDHVVCCTLHEIPLLRFFSKFAQSVSLGTCRPLGQGQFHEESSVLEKFHQAGFLHSVLSTFHVYNFPHILFTVPAIFVATPQDFSFELLDIFVVPQVALGASAL